MTSKTKLLKKGKYIPGNATPAPAKKAEISNVAKTTSNPNSKRNLRKEAEDRSRRRRMESMLKLGIAKERIEELFAQEDNRMILVLLSGQYTIQDGTKKQKVSKRNAQHKVISTETVDVPNILRGYAAAEKYVKDEGLQLISGGNNAMWILSDKNNVDNVVEKLKILGRASVTKPEQHTHDTEEARIAKEKKTPKKPTNNTAEVKANAKTVRKKKNIEKANMRPYYAALRKGGVSARVKKYNRTLADKIEKWLKERRKIEEEKAERIAEKHKRNPRQMSSIEMKRNKRARKAAKYLAAKERRIAAQKKREEINAKERAKRAQKAQKHVQTEIKMAA